MTATDDRLKTERTTLKRLPERGAHDFDTIACILDEAIFCHIGFVADGRMLRTLSTGTPVCFTATLFDGLVMARSAFHHSINYRSVIVLGTAQEVTGDEKLRGLRAITEHMARGRWADVRPPTEQELKATSVLKLEIDEASAKIRTGGPKEDPADLPSPMWAGHLPFVLVPQPPVPDEHTPPDAEPPDYLATYRRPMAQ